MQTQRPVATSHRRTVPKALPESTHLPSGETAIERAVTAIADPSNGGLIVTAGALAAVHRALIIALAARHRIGDQAAVGEDAPGLVDLTH